MFVSLRVTRVSKQPTTVDQGCQSWTEIWAKMYGYRILKVLDMSHWWQSGLLLAKIWHPTAGLKLALANFSVPCDRDVTCGPKVGQISPKRDNPRLFQKIFQYTLAVTEIWSGKSPGFVLFEVNLNHFEAKPYIPVNVRFIKINLPVANLVQSINQLFDYCYVKRIFSDKN